MRNVEQNQCKKIYRAKHVLSKVEGTPRRKEKRFVISIAPGAARSE